MVMKRRCQGDGDEAAWSVAEAGGCSYCPLYPRHGPRPVPYTLAMVSSGSRRVQLLQMGHQWQWGISQLDPRAAFSPTP